MDPAIKLKGLKVNIEIESLEIDPNTNLGKEIERVLEYYSLLPKKKPTPHESNPNPDIFSPEK